MPALTNFTRRNENQRKVPMIDNILEIQRLQQLISLKKSYLTPKLNLCYQDSSSDGESVPENLSLPKPRTAEPPSPSTPMYSPYPGVNLPYGLPLPLPQRSPVDVLLRVFPGRRRADVEAVLGRCKGDVLQAIELMVSFWILSSLN